MPTGTPGPATPAQIAMYGHIAAALRAFMKEKGWSAGQLNEAMGQVRSHTSVYHWLNSKAGPGPTTRPRLAKVMGVPQAELMPRKPGDASRRQVVAVSGPPVTVVQRPVDVLSFAVQQNGEARIRMDIVLPLAQATPLLRMILDAGIVLGAP